MSSNENLTYKIILSKSAANYIKKSNRITQERLAKAIEHIKASPLKGINIRPMVGSKGDYRYRVGDFRIIYTVIWANKEIHIYTIGPRGNVYK